LNLPIPTIENILFEKNINLSSMITKYIYQTIPKKSGFIYIEDKSPRYIDNYDILNDFFPSCPILHIVWDPRYVALSVKKDWNRSLLHSTR